MGCAPSTDARAGFAPGIRAGSPHRGQGSAGAQPGGGIAQLAALGSSSRYSSAEPVWELLFSGLIRPIRLSWFAQATSTRSRCKSLLASSPLPEAAFIPINELKEQFGGGNDAGNGDVLPLIAIASESVNPLDLREVGEMLLQHRKAFAECNFSEMGVIWAHGSFASHEAYIRTADVWFGHSGISALLIERPPAAAEQLFGYTLCAAEPISKSMQSSHTHDGAGWPTFERLAAELTQKWHAWNAPWDLVIDMAAAAAKAAPGRWGSHISKFEMHGSEWLEPAPRNWPVGPDDFALLAPSLHFDGGEPERSLAVDQYRKMCTTIFGEKRFVTDFAGLPPPSLAEAHRFGKCCNLMNQLEYLDLQHVGLKGYVLAGFFRQLRPGALPNLLALNLRHNPYGDEGLLGLCEALLKPIYAMPNLETLDLSNDTDEERFAAASFAKISSAPDAQSANRPTSVVGHSSASHHLPGAAGAQPQQQQQSSSSRPPQQSLFAPPSHVPDSNSPPTASPAAVPARGFWFQQAEQPKAVPSSTVNDLSTPRSDADTLEATRQEKVMRRRPSVEQREEVARAKESRRPSDMGTLTDAPSGQTPPLGGSYGSEVTDVGVAALANVMNADGLRSCKQLFLYGNPEIGSAGLTALTKALKRGSCASLSTIYLEGHNGSVRDEMALARVLAARDIDGDLSVVAHTVDSVVLATREDEIEIDWSPDTHKRKPGRAANQPGNFMSWLGLA